MKIIKPDHMAVLHRAFRWRGEDRLCVGLVALFPLADSRIDALMPETGLWQSMAQWPGASAVLDEGYAKARAEFLLYGEACAPGGAPVAQLAVRARIGAREKALLVQGDRHWSTLGTASTAASFSRMPITPQNAFGGVGDAVNPLGKGAVPDASGKQPLPNVEDPRHPMVFPTDRPAPAGFWGVESSAPQRQRHLGAFDKAWLAKHWPSLPDTTSDEFFQAAPEDQRLAGFFAGNEAIELTHLHPAQARIESRLPGLRGRCFARRGANGPLEEMPTRAETVWLLPGLGLGAVLYRGTMPVGDVDAADIGVLVAGWEPMSEAPWPVSRYEQQLPAQAGAAQAASADAASSAEPAKAPALSAAAGVAAAALAAGVAGAAGGAGAAGALASAAAAGGVAGAAGAAGITGAAGSLGVAAASAAAVHAARSAVARKGDTPGGSAAPSATAAPARSSAAADVEASILAVDPRYAAMAASTAEMEAQTNRLLAEHGIPRSKIDAMMRPPPPPRTSFAEVESMTRDLDIQQQKLLADHGLTQQDVDAYVASRKGPSIEQMDFDEIEAMSHRMDAQRVALLREHGLSNADVAAYLRGRGASDEAVAMMQGLDRPAEPVQAMALSASTAPAAVAGQVPVLHAAQGGAAAIARAAAGHLAEPVLKSALAPAAPGAAALAPQAAGAVASVAGAAAAAAPTEDRPPTTREEVVAWHQQGRSFAGLELGGLDLRELDLSGADFSAARLDKTQFDRSRLAGSRFDDALMQGASFSAIDGAGASFTRARAPGAMFSQAMLAGATLDAADLTNCDFEGSTLSKAQCERTDFSGSRMHGLQATKSAASQANFGDCELHGADFGGATLTAARFNSARLEGASFCAISAARSEWYEAHAPRVDFAAADLRGARAGAGTVFEGANFERAQLERASWDGGVDLRGASLRAATLDGADLSEARASGLRMPGISARGANFARAALDGANASGANLMGASLRLARLDGAQLVGSNLHGSDGEGSTIARAHASSALLTGTLMEIAGRPEAVKT